MLFYLKNDTCVLVFMGMLLLLGLMYFYAKWQKGFKIFYQKELLRARLQIQEQTFKIPSQEIHDEIGQLLSLAKLNVDRMKWLDPTNNNQLLDEAKSLTSRSIKDLKILSKTLNLIIEAMEERLKEH